MIIVRSPLRISLGGGGTDLPSYYRESEGFLIAAAIDKYVYVTISKPFEKGIFLKYSKSEVVKNLDEIEHKILREALRLYCNNIHQIEITTLTDIPAGTGLGSSGSFTTALVKALSSYDKTQISRSEIAEAACHIEIDTLKQPIGKQDQYIASYGGISSFAFHKNDSVVCAPLNISDSSLYKLEDNLLLFFTGYSRNANEILADQDIKSKKHDVEMVKNLDTVKELGFKSKTAIEDGDLEFFAELMHEHWLNKRARSRGMSNSNIDFWYEEAMKAGALGGKVVGAGGGGFLLFYTNDPFKLRAKMTSHGLQEVRFRFDHEGTKQIV